LAAKAAAAAQQRQKRKRKSRLKLKKPTNDRAGQQPEWIGNSKLQTANCKLQTASLTETETETGAKTQPEAAIRFLNVFSTCNYFMPPSFKVSEIWFGN